MPQNGPQSKGALLEIEPLTAEAFAPFGDLIEVAGPPTKMINAGMCGRHDDLARLDFDPDQGGRAGISLFDAQARALPYALDLVERHPLGSQAFLPLDGVPFLVCVAEDDGGTPVRFRAFLTAPGQGVNLLRNTWHGVLAPMGAPGRYAVVDRIGGGVNLEEYPLDPPIMISG
ncbi:Ureidoglycolate hydrolase [Rhodobacter sp. TJ_12]|uniref:ureidoglycolate lyase n=1 Tax=Rhodobacter sp. TJ_12 TaxID=2029399 RepID=UPI001CBF5864|nr:ureidoglycolate lyase [Rhodobacter sp. TJ_12]MBZ4021619.1 Ureidoglycolate hydrolase [Rhodobacter sp. TJ_12]